MPNGNTHNALGAMCGPVSYMWIKEKLDEKPEVNLEEFILSICVGTGTARIPDLLEPATNPNHRAFFHSLLFGGLLGLAGVLLWKDLQARWNQRKALGIKKISFEEIRNIVLLIAIVSVVIHLIADGFTPKGLPII